MNDEKLTPDDIACLISGIDKPSNCNDCISRQAVLDILTYKWNLYLYADDAIDAMQANIDKIKALPSVAAEQTHEEWCTDCKEYDQEQHCCHRYCKVIRQAVAEIKQAERTGHWIEHEIEDTIRWLECSECGIEHYNKKENYCPNCGARMVGDDNG